MTALLEPYSGYLLLWLLVGLAAFIGACVAMIASGEDTRRKSFWGCMLFMLVVPAALAWMLAKGVLEMVWDACKAWRGLFRSKSGTEELLLGGFWLYMAWLMGETVYEQGEHSLWGLVGAMVVTTLFLWQAARAMQQLKKESAKEAGERIHQNPPPHIMAKAEAASHLITRMDADIQRRNRHMDHERSLRELRVRADKIMALLNAYADVGSSLDRHREGFQWKKKAFTPDFRYIEE